MTPHPLQLHMVAMPFWGLPVPSPLAAANADLTSMPPTTLVAATAMSAATLAAAIAMSTKFVLTNSTVTAAPANAAAATAATAAGGDTTALLPEKAAIATTVALHISDAEQVAAPAASVQPCQTPLTTAERQQRPRRSP